MTDEQSRGGRVWTVALKSKTETSTLEVVIYDDIGAGFFSEGFTAKDFLQKLRSAPDAKTIALRINSSGGLVDDAKAMVNLLADKAAAGVQVEAYVDGMAASSASYLTTIASRVVMPSNAFLMIHESRGGARGRAADFEVAAEVMRKTNEQFAEAYAAASKRRGKKKTKEDYLAEMAKGDLYLTASEAIEWGLADEKIEAIKVAAHRADIGNLAAPPEQLRAAPYVIAHTDEPTKDGIVPPPANTPATPPAETPATPAEPAPEPLAPVSPPVPNTEPTAPASAPAAPPEAPTGEGTPMTVTTQQQGAASEPASVTISGVKLLGVSTEVEAHALVQELQNLKIAILGMTEKGSPQEALSLISAWRLGFEQTGTLTKKVAELESATRIAKRDGAIEKLSREGKLAPSAHEWARTQFQTAEQIESFALTLAPMAKLGPVEPAGGSSVSLTEEERGICAKLGMTEALYLEQKKLDSESARARVGG